jgi:RHS repeat-associated protein
VSTGEKLVAYVYLDPSNAPSEVMLQWNDGTWEHRAYWGANQIGWGADGTESRRYMGALPATGQWVRLEVPASQVGLEGHTLNGMAFTLYGGKATWDRAGKSSGGTGAGVQWLIADQLGTPRMVIDRTGSLSGVKRHDYFPFGEEIPSDMSWRTNARGYGGDTITQKFTGYERDSETSLDFAQARYYSSTQGRFTIPDPLLSSSNPLAPQSWNKYTYVSNNPLTRVDPSGLFDFGDSLGGSATDEEILNNTCAQDQCTEEERRAGKRTKAEAQRIVTERQQVLDAVKTLQSLLDYQGFGANLDANEYERLSFAVNALGNKGDHNGVVIESSSLNADPTGFTTVATRTGSTIYLKANSRGIDFAFGLVHEGQHVRDFDLRRQGKGKRLSLFEFEVRGFETEGIAAKARGLTQYPTRHDTDPNELLWNKAWAPADVHTLRNSGAMTRITNTPSYNVNGKPLSKDNPGPRLR